MFAGRHADPELARVVDLQRLIVQRHVHPGWGTAVGPRELEAAAGGDAELVLRIQRKTVRDPQSATGPERETLDVRGLRGAAGSRIA